jgi:hypothetical protein
MKRLSKSEMARAIQQWLAQPYAPTDSEPHTLYLCKTKTQPNPSAALVKPS